MATHRRTSAHSFTNHAHAPKSQENARATRPTASAATTQHANKYTPRSVKPQKEAEHSTVRLTSLCCGRYGYTIPTFRRNSCVPFIRPGGGWPRLTGGGYPTGLASAHLHGGGHPPQATRGRLARPHTHPKGVSPPPTGIQNARHHPAAY
jgi:hypothetical protein